MFNSYLFVRCCARFGCCSDVLAEEEDKLSMLMSNETEIYSHKFDEITREFTS